VREPPSDKVSLRPITPKNWQDGLQALELRVHQSQQRFVSEAVPIAAIILAKAYIRPAALTWVPYLVLDAGEQPVGMLEQVYGGAADSECWLYHFFIDARFQRRGLGTRVLQELLALIAEERPNSHEICLNVHPENDVARRLYERFGFRATGAKRDGEDVYRLELGPAA
jgi:diamine N-acetyltransferase